MSVVNNALQKSKVELWKRQSDSAISGTGAGGANGTQIFPLGGTTGTSKPASATTVIIPFVGLTVLLAIIVCIFAWIRRRQRSRSSWVDMKGEKIHQERPSMHSVLVKDWTSETRDTKVDYKWGDMQPLSATVSRSSVGSMDLVKPMEPRPVSMSQSSINFVTISRQKKGPVGSLGTGDQTTAVVAVVIAMPHRPVAKHFGTDQCRIS
ncbi:hypothetical protein FRB95_009038, partial [Tulasnella sp. JGI-2019a]